VTFLDPPGSRKLVDAGVTFGFESPLPTVRFENLALTSARSTDNTGVRVQVLRRQEDGSRLRVIDRPEVTPESCPPHRHIEHPADDVGTEPADCGGMASSVDLCPLSAPLVPAGRGRGRVRART
jgi:hypothetical protein